MLDDVAVRAKSLGNDYLLGKDDAELIGYVLNGQNFSYAVGKDGSFSWGAFGVTFATLGELRALAQEYTGPAEGLPILEDEPETVGIELFENMLDTIAFLRVRLRALADVVIEKGLVTGPELLGKYSEYHERSFQAFRDLMLLRPEIFEQRFAEWLETEYAYRKKLESGERGG